MEAALVHDVILSACGRWYKGYTNEESLVDIIPRGGVRKVARASFLFARVKYCTAGPTVVPETGVWVYGVP